MNAYVCMYVCLYLCVNENVCVVYIVNTCASTYASTSYVSFVWVHVCVMYVYICVSGWIWLGISLPISQSLSLSMCVCSIAAMWIWSCDRNLVSETQSYIRRGPDIPGDSMTDTRDDPEIQIGSCKADQMVIQIRNCVISYERLLLCYYSIIFINEYLSYLIILLVHFIISCEWSLIMLYFYLFFYWMVKLLDYY